MSWPIVSVQEHLQGPPKAVHPELKSTCYLMAWLLLVLPTPQKTNPLRKGGELAQGKGRGGEGVWGGGWAGYGQEGRGRGVGG